MLQLLSIADQSMPLTDAFKRADEVLLNAVQGISDMVQMAILGPGKPGPK